MRHTDASPPVGERKQVTAVFLDIVSFSDLASRADAEDLQSWLEDYYQKSGAIVEALGGEITEYLGDGLVAIFGLSRADELAALKAVRAALDVVGSLTGEHPSGWRLSLRAGVATGEVVVRGNVPRANWPRLTGGVTTLAQRVQSAAAPDTVLIDAATEGLLRGQVHLEAVPDQMLRGFAQPQTLYLASSRPAARPADGRRMLVGRDAELIRVAQAKCAVLVLGEAGIGKSALAAQVARMGEGRQFFLADGTATRSSYHPFKEWLLYRLKQAVPTFDAIETTFPALAPRDLQCLALILGLPEGQGLMAEFSSFALKGLIETALLRAVQTSTDSGTLVFEDLHWFDAASLDVLRHVLELRDEPSVRIVMTSRPDDRVSYLLARPDVETLRLAPLSADAAVGLLDSLSGGALDPTARDRLIQRAAGIPLFLEQLYLRGAARSDDAVPETLTALLAERIDDTGPDKPLLQKAAALGRVFRCDLLAAIAPEARDLTGRLEDLAKTGVLRRRSATEWAFGHALLCDAAYQSILRQTRRDLHDLIARVLQADFPALLARDPALLAGHQRRAGRLAEAISGYLGAAKWALMQGAFADAEAHARTALGLCYDRELDAARAPLEIECFTTLGSIVMQHQGFTAPTVRDAFDQVHRIARSQALPGPESSAALFGSFSHAIMAGDRRKSDEFLDLLTDLAGRAGDGDIGTEVRLAALAADNCGAFYAGDFSVQFRRILEIRDLYRIEKHATMIARYGMDIFAAAQMFEAPARAICGQCDRIEALVAETDAHQDRLNIGVMRPYALIWGAVPLFYAGQHAAARTRLQEGLVVAGTQGAAFWQLTGAAWQHIMTPPEAVTPASVAAFGAVVDAYAAVGANVGVPYFRAVHAGQVAAQGQLAPAYEASSAAVRQARESGLHVWYPEILRIHAAICVEQDLTEEALLALDLAISTAERQGAALWGLRAMLDRAALVSPDPDHLSLLLSRFPLGANLPELARARVLMPVP